MTPIMQTKFGKGRGNCFQASVASALDLPLDEVPDFNAEPNWFTAFMAWIEFTGRQCLWITEPAEIPMIFIGNWTPVFIFGVEGFPDENHAVVGKIETEREADGSYVWKGYVAHDPNPKNYRLTKLETMVLIS